MRFYKESLFSSVFAFWLLGSMSSFAAVQDQVVVSIKPLHSLVSAVMEGVGEPKLIVQGAGSAHSYSLKPSDAAVLQDAKVVFWTGQGMETFLEKPLETLASHAKIVTLSDTPELNLLSIREGGTFEAHDHDENEPEIHDHESDSDDDHHHDHGQNDLHIWLDTQNAKMLLEQIENSLSEADPEHATQYENNAKRYSILIDELEKEVATELEPIKDKPFIVFHDAYQYFENRFGLNAAGSITVSPEQAPGAARVQQIRNKVSELNATCVFSEPQFEPRLVNTVVEGTNAKRGVLDPLGADLPDGPSLYPQLMLNLAKSLKNCLAQS